MYTPIHYLKVKLIYKRRSNPVTMVRLNFPAINDEDAIRMAATHVEKFENLSDYIILKVSTEPFIIKKFTVEMLITDRHGIKKEITREITAENKTEAHDLLIEITSNWGLKNVEVLAVFPAIDGPQPLLQENGGYRVRDFATMKNFKVR